MINTTGQLDHQLDVQARQIEAIFRAVDHPVRIGGSSIDGRWAVFELSTVGGLADGLAGDLERRLSRTLGVPAVRLDLGQRHPTVAVLQQPPAPVDLLALLRTLPGLSPATAVLGLTDEGQPVLLNLASAGVTNILLSSAGGDDYDFLQTLFLSLALANRQSQVQLGAINYRRSRPLSPAEAKDLYPLGLLPHMVAPVLTGLETIAHFLNQLNEEAGYRLERRIGWPRLVLAVSDLHELLADGGRPVWEPLAQLLQCGPEAGIHLILNNRDPLAVAVQQLIRGNVTVRLSGRQPDARAARAATGIPDSGAEYLPRPGRFLALSAGTTVPFQVATATDYDLHLSLERLRRQSNTALVAQPAWSRSHPADPEATWYSGHSFLEPDRR